MPKRKTVADYTIVNRGQLALIETNLPTRKIAPLAGRSHMQVSLWLRGDEVPEPEARGLLEQNLGIVAGWWLLRPGASEAPPEPTPLNHATRQEPIAVRLAAQAVERASDTPQTVTGRASELLHDEQASPVERLAATAVELRRHRAEVDAALAALTERERITGRADFAAMREAMTATVSAWPLTAQALAQSLTAPTSQAYAQLLKSRAELEQLCAIIAEHARSALLIGIGKASQFDSKRTLALGLLRKAQFEDAPIDLIKTQAWRQIVGSVGDILRATPGALEAVQLGFDGSTSTFADVMLGQVSTVRFITFPATQFQSDPVGFVRTVLGCEPTKHQITILESVRDHDRTSCASGRRIGKTDALAFTCLWRYACFENSRVFITAPTEHQVNSVDWNAIRRMWQRSGICVACRKLERETRKAGDASFTVEAPCIHSAKLDGVMAEKAKTGLHATDLREITGFTAAHAEAVQGLAGSCLTFVADEASGVKDPIFEAIEGNLSGGGRLLLLGNPTQNQGEHYESFYKKKKFYNSFRVSSHESPNVAAGRVVVEGLATREWLAQMLEMHGPDSAFYKIHVLGEHAIGEDGRLISAYMIADAEARWFECEEEGQLCVGVDPAGAGGEGDESTFAVRRGNKIIEILYRRGLDDDGHLSVLLEIIKKHRRDRETTHAITDVEGVGAGTHARLRQYAASQPEVLKCFAVKSSAGAVREPNVYATIRDELGANLAKWLKHGGSIPTDSKLEQELHALELKTKITAKGERVKLIPKDELRKILKRSPDRYDACALACWEPSSARFEEAPPPPPTKAQRAPVIDPYDGRGNSAGNIDPY